MGLLGINSEDGEGVRKPEYITLWQAICSDDWVQMWFKWRKYELSTSREGHRGRLTCRSYSFVSVSAKDEKLLRMLEWHCLHGTRRDRHCRSPCVCNLHRDANWFVQAAGRKQKWFVEKLWKTPVNQNQSHVTALPCRSLLAGNNTFQGICFYKILAMTKESLINNLSLGLLFVELNQLSIISASAIPEAIARHTLWDVNIQNLSTHRLS